jgi:hypothetical protein
MAHFTFTGRTKHPQKKRTPGPLRKTPRLEAGLPLLIFVLLLAAGCARAKSASPGAYLEIAALDSFEHILQKQPDGVLANRNGGKIRTQIIELVPKSVILSPALAVSQAKALRNRLFQGCSSKI